MTPLVPQDVTLQLAKAARLWLFLDYDGTLAEFSPTPDTVVPDGKLIELLEGLAGLDNLRIAIVSGRRLAHSTTLIPIPNILIAGTYGLEIRTPQGEIVEPRDGADILRAIEALRRGWEGLLQGQPGFYLEDKRWTLAIHAKDASPALGIDVLNRAHAMAETLIPSERFRILGGNQFLEVAPVEADKGWAVSNIVQAYPYPGATLVYLGDDDKDESAFRVIRDLGGIGVVVSPVDRETNAAYRLTTPAQVRAWLGELLGLRRQQAGVNPRSPRR